MRESSIRTKILHYLNGLPQSDFWASPPGSPTALPDICGVLAGRAVYVEVKVPGKKPRKAQQYRMEKLKAAGAVVIVAQCVDHVRYNSQIQAICESIYDGSILK